MVESGAVRQARHKAHRAGDHSLCRPQRCPHAPVAVVPVAVPAGDGLAAAVAVYVASLGFPDDDPRALLGQVAVRLARLFDESDSIAAVRELRVVVGQLAEVPGQPPGPIDELQVRRAARRLDQILAGVESRVR